MIYFEFQIHFQRTYTYVPYHILYKNVSLIILKTFFKFMNFKFSVNREMLILTDLGSRYFENCIQNTS